MSTWIKRSKREPFTSEYPLLAGYYMGDKWNEYRVGTTSIPLGSATHFRSIKADPPPRELTQAEKDEVVFHLWLRTQENVHTARSAWHAALAYRDKGVLATIKEHEGKCGCREKLEQLCGGNKQ